MATTVEIDAAINTADYAKSVGEINKSLKALIGLQGQVGAGSAEYKKLQSAINDTEGKLGDLKDSFQTLRGSGIERVNSSLGLLREGFLNADPGKLSIAFDGLKAAMAAVPIFLLVEGVKLLIENFDEVKKVLFGTTNEVENQAYALKALEAQQQATKASTDAYVDSLNKQLETLALTNGPLALQLSLLKERTDIQVKSIDEQIKKTEESIKLTEEQIEANKKSLDQARLQAAGVSLSYESQVNAANTALQATLDKDKKELASLKSLQITKDNVIAKGAADEKKAIQDVIDKENEAYKKRQEALDKFIAERIAKRERERRFNEGGDAEIAAMSIKTEQKTADQIQSVKDDIFLKSIERGKREFAIEQDARKKTSEGRLQIIEEQKNAELAEVSSGSKAAFEIESKYAKLALQEKIKASQSYVNYAQQTLNFLSSLNQIQTQNENYELNQRQYAKDAAIENDNNRTQEAIYREQQRSAALLQNDKLTAEQREAISANSEKIQEQISLNSKNNQLSINNKFEQAANDIRKKQFERNKKLQIAQGIVNTAASVLQTLSSTPYPANIPLAFAAAAAGAAQVAIISSQKYDDGGLSARQAVRPADIGVSSNSGPQSTFSPNQSISQPGSVQFDPTKVQNAQGNKSTRVYVLESDIREVMGKVDVFESRANF